MVRRKFQIGERVIGSDRKASYRGRIGTVWSYNVLTHEYEVLFDGETEPDFVPSHWLEKLR